MRACFIVLGTAVLLEYLQTFTPDRHGRLLDASEKVLGGALGVIAAFYLSRRKENSKGQS